MAGSSSLPWVNAPVNTTPAILGDIGDTLVSAAKNRQQQQQQAAQNLLAQQRLDAEQARMRAEESRAQAEEHRAAIAAEREQRQAEANAADRALRAQDAIHARLEAGDEGGAMAVGQATGVKVTRQPLAMQDPGAAPAEPQQPAAGPLPSMQQQQIADMQPGSLTSPEAPRGTQAIDQTQQMQGERQQYAQALADHPRLVAEHQAHLDAFQKAKENPVYDIQSPYGKSTFDLGAIRAHQQAQQAETAGTLSQGLPPQYALRAAALVKSGLTPTEASKQIEAQMRADEDRQMRRDIAGGKNETSLGVAAMREAARKKTGGGGGGGLAPGGKAWTKEETELAGELNKYEANHRLTGKDSLNEHQHDLRDALAKAQANPNGTDQLAILDKMIRANTGLGVRNQMLDTYMSHMGGLAAQGEGKLEKWVSGEVGKHQWANVVASVQKNLAEAEARGGAENKQFWDMAGKSEAMQRHPDLIKRREQAMFGGMAGYGKAEQKAAPKDDRVHPREAAVGDVKELPNGTKVRKVGPNQWEPVK